MSTPKHANDSPPKLTLFGQEFRADPYPTYAAMRAQWPIYGQPYADGSSTTWFVTGYDDVAAVLRDHKRFVKDYRNTLTPAEQAALPEEPSLLRLVSHHMLNLDPPDHTRLRGLVNKAFTVRMVEQLAPRVQLIADQLIDAVAARGHMDLIEEFAFPLPIIVIADMLGVPARDRNRFRSWSHALVAPTPNLQRNTKKLEKSRRLMEDFIAYLRGICAERRSRPQDDLITSLLQAEEAGDTLTEEELFSMVLLLVVVGHETSVNLIGNGMLALLTHPPQMEALRADPTLLPRAVEEMLRYDCPVERAPMRFAACDTEFGGQQIRRGDSISLVLGSANRDQRLFSCPATFDIHRDGADDHGSHLAFGLGIHYCLGAALARLEGRVAVAALLDRLPNLHLTVDPATLRRRTNPIMRSLVRLPVAWDHAAGARTVAER